MKIFNTMIYDQQASIDSLQAILDMIIASRSDLMLLAVGVICYLVLLSSRTKAKRVQCHYAAKLSSGADAPQQPLNVEESISQRYETLLSLHVAKHEHSDVQQLIDSMRAAKVQLGEAFVNSLLSTCIGSKDVRMARMLQSIVNSHEELSDATRSLQIQALSQCPQQVCDIISEVLKRPAGSHLSFDLVLSILSFCRTSVTNRPLADELLKNLGSTDADVLGEFIEFYLDTYQHHKACDVYELNFATFYEDELGQETQWNLMQAALKCGRLALANNLLETSQPDAAKHLLTIQRWWRHSSTGLSRVRTRGVGDVFARLAEVFNEQFPYDMEDDEHEYVNTLYVDSGDESTCFGDDDDSICDSDGDSEYDANDWSRD